LLPLVIELASQKVDNLITHSADPEVSRIAMQIGNDDYLVEYDPGAARVACSGVMRLAGEEYAPIGELLRGAAGAGEGLTLDLSRLDALNSSGITIFARFILELRRRQDFKLTVIGSQQILWQPKSLANFKLLLPDIELVFND
jgi:hypothetical protein